MGSTATLNGVALKKIVFGTDFSPVAECAATYAKGLALSFSASVDVACMSSIRMSTWMMPSPRLHTLDDRLAVRSEKLETLAKTFAAKGLRTKTDLPVVRPSWSGLLKAAETEKADLIVVATRSKAQLKRVFVGSTVEELIRQAPQPVLTVGPRVPAAADGPLEFRRIVYATDFSPQAEKAAQAALLFAEHGTASLHVCHVIDCRANVEERATEEMCGRTWSGCWLVRRWARTTASWTLRMGAPAESILALAERVKADLIVMGPRKHSFCLTHVKRGVMLEVLAQATCPVLTVH